MTEKEIQRLASKFLSGRATKAEEALLHAWYESEADDSKPIVINTDNEVNVDVKERLFLNIKSQIPKTPKLKNKTRMLPKRIVYYAASLFFIISLTSVYFYLKMDTDTKNHFTKLLNEDIGPGGNHAILELADGTKINLDHAVIGSLASKNGLVINKIEEGIVELEVDKITDRTINKNNTIHTPKGGQYRVKLPDGTMVWLNALSAIKFPDVFEDNIRVVEIEGEAYFEVAHHSDENGKTIPFIVNSKNQQIEVLGTHFNVNNYVNEKVAKTTLIEGSVKVSPSNSKKGMVLKPGQRSLVQNGDVQIGAASMESDVSWKNGDFIFDRESLESIMRKIERWYDVEIVYENTLDNRRFSGAISRSKNLSEVLKVMQLTGKVKFKIEGRRVLVMA